MSRLLGLLSKNLDHPKSNTNLGLGLLIFISRSLRGTFLSTIILVIMKLEYILETDKYIN